MCSVLPWSCPTHLCRMDRCRFAWIDSAGRFGITPRTDGTPWGQEVEVTFTIHSFSEDTPDFTEGRDNWLPKMDLVKH